MRTIFSALDFHPRDRLSSWYDVANRTYAVHHCNLKHAVAFNASLSVAGLGDVGVSVLESDAIEFTRTPGDIAKDIEHNVFICLVASGRASWGQDGREGAGGLGDFTLLESQRPYAIRLHEPTKLIILRVPHRLLEQRVGPTIGLTAIPISGQSNIGGLAGGFLALLPDRLPLAAGPEEARIAELTLDLVAMALFAERECRPKFSAAREVALVSLQSAIEANLGDPDLTADRVAKQAGISVRYASSLLSEQGSSVGRYILQRRLERCRKLLEDPAHAHRTITDIALSWGFSDSSHFGRRFKEAYGQSPSDCRPPQSRSGGDH